MPFFVRTLVLLLWHVLCLTSDKFFLSRSQIYNTQHQGLTVPHNSAWHPRLLHTAELRHPQAPQHQAQNCKGLSHVVEGNGRREVDAKLWSCITFKEHGCFFLPKHTSTHDCTCVNNTQQQTLEPRTHHNTSCNARKQHCQLQASTHQLHTHIYASVVFLSQHAVCQAVASLMCAAPQAESSITNKLSISVVLRRAHQALPFA